ncbi:ABC transporter permease [Paenibacillus sp. CF384]|uniref:ABC transporter permease n=1 Tax=Paenibacillus sp. CF384 TaxID=1884382 RepID=UPI000896DABA|nr:ABC transporter permease [Paenibacillus sp. CF384]SDX71937.1 ABC-2 type transport system permease protein [Paenibacillus sp. CF384]
MNQIRNSLEVEILKIIKSNMLWLTILGFTFAPLMLGFLMFIQKNPEFARNAGLLGKKANLAGEADWPAYFGMIAQVVSIGGIILFGFVAAWVFGREYTDRTIKDLLALPISRTKVVLSKFIAIALWCTILSLVVIAVGLVVGFSIGLPGWSSELARYSASIIIGAAVMNIVLCTPVAFIACYGRGYMAPMGFVIGTIFLSQIIGTIGYGAYFPWSIPAFFSGAAGPENAELSVVSYVIVVLSGLLGMYGTLTWWRMADQR